MYAVGAFVLLQIGDVAFDPLGLPAGSQRLLIILLIIGFPIAAVLGWIFDITPEGIVRTTRTTGEASPGAASLGGATLDRLIIVGLIGLVAVLIWDPPMPWDSTESAEPPVREVSTESDTTQAGGESVAVLAFKSLSPVAEDAYFAEGMATEIKSVLTRIPDIRTVSGSRGSSGAEADPRVLGKQLGVAYLLDGSVRKSDDTVRITAQMTRVSDGRLVWTETYEQTVDDIFAIQDEIAETVAISLRSTLYREGISARARGRTLNPAAYDHYLTALYYRSLRWDLVDEYTAQAIDADPAFGLAHALRARAYLTRLGGQIPAAQAFPIARSSVERALRTDPDDPETLLMLGHLERAAGNYREAERIYRSVKSSSPNVVSTDLANLLQLLGRLDESVDEYERSRRLNPTSGTTFYVMALVSAGRIQEALNLLEQDIAVIQQPGTQVHFQCFHAMLSAFSGERVADSMLDEFMSAVPRESYSTLGYLVYTLAISGRRADAEKLLIRVEERARRSYVSPILPLYGAMGLEEPDRFFVWLNRCIDEQVLMVTSLVMSSPLLDPFRDDPRFDAALDRLNLLSDS
jgi:TolB-like protein